jgi:hypothetical protein
MPEHLEILGPTGSGKSYVLVDILKERARRRGSAIVYIVTKAADSTVENLDWPIVDTWREVTRNDQCVYWPHTSKLGTERKIFQAERVEDLLNHLWKKDANTVVVFDEFVYVEDLGSELKDLLAMYLREGRSHGITVVGGKQRVQGVQRNFHSETDWKIAFKMNDADDNERLAQLFGNKRVYVEVIDDLDREKHEFLIQHKLTDTQYISWVDRPPSTSKGGEVSAHALQLGTRTEHRSGGAHLRHTLATAHHARHRQGHG